MNTGDKNIKGRAILKGPRGGLYVIGPSGAKLSSFTKATAVAPAVAPTNANTFTHKGVKFIRMVNATAYGNPVYKKTGVDTYYTIPRTGARVPAHILLASMINKTNGTRISLKNYKKSKTVGAPAPVPTPPRAAKKTGAVPPITKAPPITATASRLTTAERNVRLAAIRARLNAMRAAKVAAMPKQRVNVEKRLKNAVVRVRARLRGNNPTRSTMLIPFCHAPASVPRRACTIRGAKISVYNSPMVADGTMLAMRASDIDLDWFRRQDEYVKNLSDYDFWTAQAHTNMSHKWIGPFLYRGTVPSSLPVRDDGFHTHIAPLWPQVRKMILDDTYVYRTGADAWQDSWARDLKRSTDEKYRYNLFSNNSKHLSSNTKREALKMYRDDLKRIIAGAPKSRKQMVLYRGASFDIFRSTRGHWHNLESFCSASYYLKHALMYEGGTMQRITVLPGTPVLLVAGLNQWNENGEYEIMVNLGTKYLIRGRAVKRIIWTGQKRTTRVTDVTIAK
jgi:hypothetical protein